MSFGGGDKVRDQFKRYVDTALSFAKVNRDDLEHSLRDLLQPKGSDRDAPSEMFHAVRNQARRGFEVASTLIRAEMKREFAESTRRGRDEVSAIIERLVCLVEDRFGSNGGHTSSHPHDRSEEKAWRVSHAADDNDGPAKSGAKKAASKKSAAKKAAAKKSTDKSVKKAAAKTAGTKKAAAKKLAAKKQTEED